MCHIFLMRVLLFAISCWPLAIGFWGNANDNDNANPNAKAKATQTPKMFSFVFPVFFCFSSIDCAQHTK